ncbi:MAG: energy-coupling factor transporter transmembrane protein EcfT [Caldilineales bacterium]|nr:energy-coupling factor transporter transmembrane protein EcfT [Caldilineales bacterium]MCW5859732.1 hypothetical protein [Caldilineales bacterium]
MTVGYHPYAWISWLAAAFGIGLLTRNPLYLLVAVVSIGFVFAVLVRRQPAGGTAALTDTRPAVWKPVVRLALFLGLFTVAFNALTSHTGDYSLVSLPASWPLIGGPITLEAILYGLTSALGFLVMILAFSAFNSAVGPHTLLRLTPAFALPAGVALTIAVSFIPETVAAWGELRQAQRLRGHRTRGLADMQPLFVSLLGIGLDRAIQLAESMEARGFGHVGRAESSRRRQWAGAGILAGLILLLAGLLLRSFLAEAAWPGLVLILVGSLLLVLLLWRQGQRLPRSRYRRWLWRRTDTVVMAASLLALAGYLVTSLFFPRALFYYPYPPYPLLPPFNPLLGLIPALLLAPALLFPAPQPQPTP